MKRNGAAAGDGKLAPFAAVEAAPADPEMWPAHPAGWLEPDLAPVVPASSGLRVERRYAVPAPDLLRLEPLAAIPPPARAAVPEMRPPACRTRLPESGLAPLGWDPRAVCRKGDR